MPRSRRSNIRTREIITTSKAHRQTRRKKHAAVIGKSGLLNTVLNGVERAAELAPGIIRGVRNFTGMKSMGSDAVFATPSSFAIIQNNPMMQAPERVVTHPTKGCSGIQVRGSMPLATVNVNTLGSNNFGSLVPYSGTSGQVDLFHIPMNPLWLGGELAATALLYDNYVFDELIVKFVTSQTTTYLGTLGMCFEKDFANILSQDFDSLRQVQPCVVFPIRVPESLLRYSYKGPELYYKQLQNEPDATFAPEGRQEFQCVFGLQSPVLGGSTLGDVLGYLDVEYVCSFYNRTPPDQTLPKSHRESQAVRLLLSKMRGESVRPRPAKQPALTVEDLAEILKQGSPPEPTNCSSASVDTSNKETENRITDLLGKFTLSLKQN